VFTDAGVSGANGIADRTGLPAALLALEDRTATGIVVARLDRLARKLAVQEAILVDVWAAGATAFEVGSGIVDPDDEDRTFYRQVMGAVAELDKAKTLRRLNAGREAKRSRDGWAGGMVPYGHRIDPDTKTLVPDDAEQRVLREARRMRARGASWRTITRHLNRTMGGNPLTPPRRGSEWFPMTVKRIVEREDAKP
jgi:DNA invertase Pin-like site-specific DNA recombinase